MASKRGTLSARKITKELNVALNRAVSYLGGRHRIMTAEMLLLAFIQTPEVEAHPLLRDFSRDRGFDWATFERDVERMVSDQSWSRRPVQDQAFDFMADTGERISLSREMLIVLDEGLQMAEEQEGANTPCTSVYALAAMTEIQVGTHWPLSRRGITKRAVLDTQRSSALVVMPPAPAKGRPTPLVYLRTELLGKLVNLLSMTRSRHVILVGPAGVGKKSLVLALNQIIAQGEGPAGLKAVVQLDEQALLDDALSAVKAGLYQARQGILFVPDTARFFGGIRADFREDACNELQKAFFGNDPVIIGTASEERYQEKLSKATAVLEHSQILRVPPATVTETTEILKTLRPSFEADYGLSIVEKSLAEATRLAGRYYSLKPLPAAAVHLLHQACAMVKTNLGGQQLTAVKSDNQLDPEDVMVAASLLTGIPATIMGADERNRYANMVEHLHQRIIGQDEAIVALSRAVKMARVGLKDPKRPIGSFMFLGPTGVGKTELAKALAEFMFGTEDALITLDMSEYMDDSSVNRLIGSPPGYVDSQAGGQLTEAVKKRPYSVILFDEVEKASVKVFDVLLQVMDEGRLTSGLGDTVSFSECVILMTSNIGGRYLADRELSEAFARDAAEEALKEHFRPEFLNRLDEIIFFHLLTADHLRQILDLLLKKEVKMLAGQEFHLELSDGAKSWLLAQNDHPEWGARPLRRIIQKFIREPIADFILKENLESGATIKITVKGKKLAFDIKKQ